MQICAFGPKFADLGETIMNTPICDFVDEYKKSKALRLHMPGHKGREYLGVAHEDEAHECHGKGDEEEGYPDIVEYHVAEFFYR